MATQSVELKAQVVAAWEKSKWFPKDLLQTEHNFNVLGKEVAALSYVDLTIIVGLVNRLTQEGRLQYNTPKIVEKIVEQIVEVEKPAPVKTAKQLAREQREAAIHAGIRVYGSDTTEFDRQSPQRMEEDKVHNANVKAHNQLSARHCIEREIQNYMVVSPSGRTDHAKTHQRREELRKIKILFPGTEDVDYVATVNAVAEKIHRFETGTTDYDTANMDFRGNRR